MNASKTLATLLLSGAAIASSVTFASNPSIILKFHNLAKHPVTLNNQTIASGEEAEFRLAGGETMTGSVNSTYSDAADYTVKNTDEVCCWDKHFLHIVYGVVVDVTVNGHTIHACPTRWTGMPWVAEEVPVHVSFLPDAGSSSDENILVESENTCNRASAMDRDDDGYQLVDYPRENDPHQILKIDSSLLGSDS